MVGNEFPDLLLAESRFTLVELRRLVRVSVLNANKFDTFYSRFTVRVILGWVFIPSEHHFYGFCGTESG